MRSYGAIISSVLLITIAFLLILASPPLMASNYFIVAGGTGNKSGTDWNNALPDLPGTPAPNSGPTCGSNLFIAGGTYNWAHTHYVNWTANCTASAPVNVYKAVDCSLVNAPYCSVLNPANIPGWKTSYGSLQAVFIKATATNLEENVVYNRMIGICGSYYTIDGVTPVTGTPTKSGFGIVLRDGSPRDSGIVISSNGQYCTTTQADQLSHISVRHVEIDGVDPQYGFNIASCKRSKNVVSLVLTTTPTQWIVGNNIDVAGVTPNDFNTPHAGNGVAITSLSGSTLTFNQVGPDEVCTIPGYAGLNVSPGAEIVAGNLNQTFDSITFSDNYVHDLGGGASFINTTNVDYERNYKARNRSTFTQHENSFVVKDAGTFTANGGVACNPCIVAGNIFENVSGTQVAGFLGSPKSNDFRFYNNVVFCSDDAGLLNTAANPQCVVSRLTGDNGANGACAANTTVIGNTFYGGAIAKTDFRVTMIDSCSSTTVQNNLWFTNGRLVLLLGGSGTEDHNTYIGTDRVFNFNSPSDSVQTTNIQVPFVSVAPPQDFRLASDTVDPHLNDGIPLPAPYDVDFTGAQRGGGSNWDRGAFAFNPVVSPPAAPTITSVVVK